MIDYGKSARVTMLDKATLEPAFDVVVYGVEPGDLMRIPNPTIHSLSRRFPHHQSSPFHIQAMPQPKPAWVPWRERHPFRPGIDE